MKNLPLSHDEAAFLLVLLNEEPNWSSLPVPVDQIDLPALTERVRRLCWEFHWDGKDNMPVQSDTTFTLAFDASDRNLARLHDVLIDLQDHFDRPVTYDLVREILREDELLLADVIKWGGSDTEVGDTLYRNVKGNKYPTILPRKAQ